MSTGNIMGKLITPTTSAASGVWNLREQQLARNASIWPGLVTPAVATGGTITTVGGYKIHTFTSSGTFTVTGAGSVQYLVVAGGGGGGYCGGGGAGGYRCSVPGEYSGGLSSAEPLLELTVGSYAITVGNGGAAGPNASPGGGNGENSSIASLVVATGGGGGGAYQSYTGRDGGSGGGGTPGAGAAASGGTPVSGQGFAGGARAAEVNGSGSGGGGAGGVGSQGTSGQVGGNGGVGLTSYITGSALNLAGGGGGGTFANSYPSYNASSSGGYGGQGSGYGGGNGYIRSGGVNISPTAGTANTGGGGGGGGVADGGLPTYCYTAAGGSGIVIIRYAI